MIRVLTSMIILLIITTFGYTDVEKQQKFSPNESQLKELIPVEQFESLSGIPRNQRENVFGLMLQISGITLKHSIEKVDLSIINCDEALQIIEKRQYYVEDLYKPLSTALYFLLIEQSGAGYGTYLTPASDPEALFKTAKSGLNSGRLSYILEMKTVPKDNERIHSLKMYQIKYR